MPSSAEPPPVAVRPAAPGRPPDAPGPAGGAAPSTGRPPSRRRFALPAPLDAAGPLGRYSLALALFGIALAARFALVGTLPSRGFPFLTFFPAVMLTAYLAGLGPGLACSALSVAAAWYWFIGPTASFDGLTGPDVVALVFFAAILTIDVVIIHVMNRSLARVRETERQLREADARKDEFLAMLAHELRNPLAPMVNAVRLLQRRETLSGPGQSAVAMLERQTVQMRRLVDDLLDLSRITRGRIAIVPEPVDLHRLVEEVAESIAPLLAQRAQTLGIERPPAGTTVVADPVRLVQVIENLLLNASKFSPDGSPIVVSLHAGPDGARIRVADRGIGLAPEELERVFEMFAQAGDGHEAASADRAQGGLGIGLAMVRRIVELHGGRTWAESTGRGQGATFVVELPPAPALPA